MRNEARSFHFDKVFEGPVGPAPSGCGDGRGALLAAHGLLARAAPGSMDRRRHDAGPEAGGGGQIDCWLTYTNEKTHQIIRDNLHRSALYGGFIEGIGPRYCPSIEDKINRFQDKKRHQLFVEPEGITTDEVYLQGMSTSMPQDIQMMFYRSIPGLENM